MKNILSIIVLLLLVNISAYSMPATGTLTGEVIDAENNRPLPGITVRIVATKWGAITDNKGRFTIKNIEPGIYTVQVTGVAYATYSESNVPISSGKPAMFIAKLTPKDVRLKTAKVEANYYRKNIEKSTSTQSFNSEDIRRAPGVNEDVLRATQLFPGVAVTSAGRNDLLVRGGAPFENLFLVDGIEIPNLNHFGSQGSTGGPLSLINIDLVRSVDFSSGGFGAKYGDKLSSITDITLRKGNMERFAAEATVSATGASLILEGPLSENASYLLSARRSYLDFIFEAAGFSFIPQYWDLSLKVDYRINNDNQLSYLFIGALDHVRINNDDEDDRYSNSRVMVPRQNQYFTGLSWKTLFDKGFATFTFGRTFSYFNTSQQDSLLNTIFQNKSNEGEMSLKASIEYHLGNGINIIAGNQVKYGSLIDFDILVPGYVRLDDQGIPQPLEADTSFNPIKNATFINLNRRFGDFDITLGGRMDYFNFLESSVYFSPRASVLYNINELMSLGLSGGRYYQSPSYIWLVGGTTEKLSPLTADQIVASLQYLPTEDIKVQFEAYYKDYSKYPARVYRPQSVLAPSGFDDITTDIPYGLEPIVSQGTGYSRGVELFIQKKLSDIPLYGLLSLTLSETKFAGLDGIERWGDFDTRFIFNFSGGYLINDEWEISGKFRYATGQPETGFLPDGSIDFINYNDGGRFPDYHALDIRVDKRWNFESFSMITYIDVANVYNRNNIGSVKWDYRAMAPEYNESFGVLPTIGMTFEF